jgi:hypothetical protein
VGCDAGKKVKGRKIHALVASEGLPMRVVVHSAAIQDRDGGRFGARQDPPPLPAARTDLADGGYNAWQVDAALAKVPRLRMEIVKRSDDVKALSCCRAAGWSNAPSPGSGATAASPRTSKTSPNRRHLRHHRFYPTRPQAACPSVRP